MTYRPRPAYSPPPLPREVRRRRVRSQLTPSERMQDGFTAAERIAAQLYLERRRQAAQTWEPMWESWMP